LVSLIATPFLMANDVAQTSSMCDKLMYTINDVGIKHGDACFARVAWLETRLKQLNHGQGAQQLRFCACCCLALDLTLLVPAGLGFKVAGAVLDQRLLKTVALALGGGLTTLITTLLALDDTPAAAAGSNISSNTTDCSRSWSGSRASRQFANAQVVYIKRRTLARSPQPQTTATSAAQWHSASSTLASAPVSRSDLKTSTQSASWLATSRYVLVLVWQSSRVSSSCNCTRSYEYGSKRLSTEQLKGQAAHLADVEVTRV